MNKVFIVFFIIGIISFNSFDQTVLAQWEPGVLHSFNGNDGAISKGSLTLFGDMLYGRTSAGGTNGEGVIFKVNIDSSNFQVLYNFQTGSGNGLGKEPHHDAMLYYDDNLYGTALEGGQDDNGVIYKISLTGADYTPIHVFTGGNNDGSQPHSGVIEINSIFYGITAAGGTHDNGTLYKINPDGSGFSVLYSFHNSDGDNSHGRLTLGSDGHTLFGMTKEGGSSDDGVIFSYDLSSSDYTILHTFTGSSSDGSSTDHGFVTISNDTIFGMTQLGGSANEGVLYSINDNGTNFQILHSFGSSTNDGSNPYGSLQLSNGFLYGTTREGGDHDHGTVFRISKDGTVYEILYSLKRSTIGEYPIDNVVLNEKGDKLYCLSQAGGIYDTSGSNQYGTVFALSDFGSIGISNISTNIPPNFNLYQNYPNPFNPVTKIRFDIATLKSHSSNLKLLVYNSAGQEVETVLDRQFSPGTYEVTFDGKNYSSGIYFYSLISDEFITTRKFILMK